MSDLSPEAQRILELVKEGKAFLLSGGAGSGKTFTLVEAIRASVDLDPASRIACITYTNAAADEIRARVDSQNLWVSTIHDFMWDKIKGYQRELKQALRELLRSDAPEHARFVLPSEAAVEDDLFEDIEEGIQYREFLRMRDGIISHDEVLILAAHMFACHAKLCRIVKDRYPCIFVDEYQDTSPVVVGILLDSFRASTRPCVVGFFGDAMQAIYPGTVGNLKDRVEAGDLVEVKKEQNRRNPRRVIELANRLRNDGLVQHSSDDPNAPNMVAGVVREGVIRFVHSSSSDLAHVRERLGWGDEGVKELNLTHNLIASQAGFARLMELYDGDRVMAFVRRIKQHVKDHSEEIDPAEKTFGAVVDALQAGKTGAALRSVSLTPTMESYVSSNPAAMQTAREAPYEQISRLYVSKDQLLDDTKDGPDAVSRPASQRDELVKHLFRIQNCIRAYQNGQYAEFVRLTDFTLRSVGDKTTLRAAIEALASDDTMLIGDAIERAARDRIVQIDDRLDRFKEEKAYLYDRVVQLPFSEFQCLYAYLEGHSPFLTQHKTKGREYRRVLTVLDNGGWNNYSFRDLFAGGGSESVRERTAKIFYVCCTRAMEELAVFYHDPPESVITTAKQWFGEDNVLDLDVV